MWGLEPLRLRIDKIPKRRNSKEKTPILTIIINGMINNSYPPKMGWLMIMNDYIPPQEWDDYFNGIDILASFF